MCPRIRVHSTVARKEEGRAKILDRTKYVIVVPRWQNKEAAMAAPPAQSVELIAPIFIAASVMGASSSSRYPNEQVLGPGVDPSESPPSKNAG